MQDVSDSLQGREYDYVFCGAGCASLSIVMRMVKSGKFTDKKILLIDKESKTKNDRTWCFWEKENGFFDEIVFKKWNSISFFSNYYSATTPITPYQYKMIRGIDFYNHCFKELQQHANLHIAYATIDEWQENDHSVIFKLNGKNYSLGKAIVFNSVYTPQATIKKETKLLQHFKGWRIETPIPVFDASVATMMDFRVHQQYGTTFIYVLPLSETSALVEYTLFAKDLLKQEQYDAELKNYIKEFLKIDTFTVVESEFGIIPMTNEKFNFKGHGWQIGTAGGQTKASSGYTFQFIQKRAQQIVDCLISGKSLESLSAASKKYRFYDNTLLDVLYHNKLPGDKVFAQFFKKNKPQQVLRFLDNETSLREEIKLISSLPVWPFLTSAMKQF
jgi:lycopene beta-cyclase